MLINQRLILTICFVALAIDSNAQNDLSLSNYGKYHVGLKDTVIFKSDESFTTSFYSGPKPFFIKIWYPSNEKSRLQLQFKDLYTVRTPTTKSIPDSTSSLIKGQIIRYTFSSRLFSSDIKPGVNEFKMYDELLKLPIRSAFKLVRIEGKLPCIFYHHGANSFNFDNYLFCEFMASHGFVVIASNFEWPLGGSKYTNSTDKNITNAENDNISFVVNYVLQQNYIDKNKIYAVGHSWGAQNLSTFDSPLKPFKLIFSLHTTAEHLDDQEALRIHKDLYLRLKDEKNELTTKTIAFAPYHQKLTFTIFNNNKNAIYDYIVADQPMTHDGFISLGNLKIPFLENFEQGEQRALALQFNAYVEVVNYIKNEIASSGHPKYTRLWRFLPK